MLKAKACEKAGSFCHRRLIVAFEKVYLSSSIIVGVVVAIALHSLLLVMSSLLLTFSSSLLID